ncbi:tripartite tricarboxylate transporter substrate binding protein [uncultured Pseudacidovorax sp.]|uniref:Bug family tripartite tricarboxylate transporter substrate binding protein n=1 Tax=uncultured Pseudacidovorax sp. TaxID=679313 RepID=UPI0025DF096E|nr:tripartite tricarboxylate transporter substrate binding protein [uncultured Pseudacidovorax sp.]
MQHSLPSNGLTRRQLSVAVMAALAACRVSAGNWPERPIRLLVGFPPGGGPDLLARALADALQTARGWNVVVVNKPGAGGNLGTDEVARAAPDGYTVLFGHVGALAVNPSLYRRLSFDPQKDLVPVSMLATSPLVIVTGTDRPFRSFREVVDEARKRPGTISAGFSGTGTISHLSLTQLAALSGTRLSFVPYKGASQGIVDVVGGNLDLYVSSMASLLGHVRNGKVRALAVTSAGRAPDLPDVATLSEQGFPGFEATTWFGMMAPVATPAAVVNELQHGVEVALKSPALLERYRTDGSEAVSSTSVAFGRFLQSETQRWAKVVREAGVEVQ